jgi:hypothetical protein
VLAFKHNAEKLDLRSFLNAGASAHSVRFPVTDERARSLEFLCHSINLVQLYNLKSDLDQTSQNWGGQQKLAS